MLAAPIPPTEASRLAALVASVTRLEPDGEYEALSELAARALGMPIATVGLVDGHQVVMKGVSGQLPSVIPRWMSFCGHVVFEDEFLLIADARQHAKFSDNPLVIDAPAVRFYAGCPVRSGGQPIGAIAVWDRVPRAFGADQRQVLRGLATVVEALIAAKQLAHVDALTGLLNRRGLMSASRRVLSHCDRAGDGGAVVLFDLDDFKSINDEQGHAAGDAALMLFAGELRASTRQCDVVGRLAGDEFAVLLPRADRRGAEAVLARLTRRLNDAWRVGIGRGPLQFSYGVSTFEPAQFTNWESLLAVADERMYQNKVERRGRLVPSTRAAAAVPASAQ